MADEPPVLTLSEASLDFALAHMKARGDTDILPRAFELEAIAADWANVRGELARKNLYTWVPGPARRCLSPKRELAFRIATQLDLLDTLIITALVYEAGPDIEASRIPASEQIVHSYRFDPEPTGQLYSTDWSFETFRHQSIELAGQASFVLLTDIADFFTRIYSHPLENALDAALKSQDHARVIARMISGLNQRVSHGLPVGPAVFRLLADLVIGDVDQALLSEGYTFCRYSDDYRIFTADERTAREACAFLANILLRNHGLTLQESKTDIIPASTFVERFERSERDAERARLRDQFDGLWGQYRDERRAEADAAMAANPDDLSWVLIDLDDYNSTEYSDLDDEQKAIIDSLNLWSIVEEQRDSESRLDVPMVKFVLRRIADLGLVEPAGEITNDISPFYPVFPEAVEAIASQQALTAEQQDDIGGWLISLFDHPVVGHLEYHRAWVLGVFAQSDGWGHTDELVRMYDKYADPFTRAGVVRALGVAGVAHWFRARKQDLLGMPPWERRAFLDGARCLPSDEARHWYRSVIPQLAGLDQLVAKWALNNI